MKLQQLRYVLEVARQGLSVSAAAAHLYTSQPAVSKQLRALEDELGVPLFQRRGKQFVGLTAAGLEIVALAEDVLRRAESIRRVAQDHAAPQRGELGIATTHTLARYRLPPVIARFREHYPQVRIRLLQGTPAELPALAREDGVDLVLTPQGPVGYEGLVLLPCDAWRWGVLVPCGHSLAATATVDLAALAAQPLVTYTYAFAPGGVLATAFAAEGLRADVTLAADDTSVLKTYVRAGLGAGLLAADAWLAQEDADLACLAVPALPASVVHVGFQRELRLRGYASDFITAYAPHLTRDLIVEAAALRDPAAIAALVATSAPAALI